jgi:ketosteroid isomerase-like protein
MEEKMAANDHEVLHALNANYVRSVAESDVRWFDENLSKDFLNTNPDCTIIDRAGFLKRISNPVGVTDLHPEDVNIRLFGDFAIIHARTVYTKPDGSAGAGRYTDIWARQGGRWLCVAAHVARG